MAAEGTGKADQEHSQLTAELVGDEVLVWDLETAKALRSTHRIGMTGLGGLRQSKAHVRRKAGSLPMILTTEEVRLGLECGFLRVVSSSQQPAKSLQWHEISSRLAHSARSEIRFAVYKDLHSHGWYFTDGLRFGVDFLLYGCDPSTAHAPLMVTITEGSPLSGSTDTGSSSQPEQSKAERLTEGISPLHLAALQRVAHRSAKQVLQAWVRCFPDGSPGAILYHEVTRSYSPAPMPAGVEYV